MNNEPGNTTDTAPERINNHLVEAVLATLFCCQIGGIISIVYACQVNGALARGDAEGAQMLADKAAWWIRLSLIVGIVCYGIGILCQVLAFLFAESAV